MSSPFKMLTVDDRKKVILDLTQLITQHIEQTPNNPIDPQRLAQKVEETVYQQSGNNYVGKSQDEYYRTIAKKHLLIKEKGQRGRQAQQPPQIPQQTISQPPPSIPLRAQPPPAIPNNYSHYPGLPIARNYTQPGQYPVQNMKPTQMEPMQRQVPSKPPELDPEYTQKLAELRLAYGGKLKNLMKKISEVSSKNLNPQESQHMNKTKQTVWTLVSVLQGTHPRTRNLQTLLQTEPILQKYFNRPPPTTMGRQINVSLPEQTKPLATNQVQPQPQTQAVAVGQNYPTTSANMSSINQKRDTNAVVGQVKSIGVTQNISQAAAAQYQANIAQRASQASTGTPSVISRMKTPISTVTTPPVRPITPKDQKRVNKVPNVQYTLNKFVDCICMPNQRPAHLLPEISKMLSLFEKGTLKEDTNVLKGSKKPSKIVWWESNSNTSNKTAENDLVGLNVSDDKKNVKRNREVLSTDINVLSKETTSCTSKENTAQTRKLAKLSSSLDFSLERQRAEVLASIKSNSIVNNKDDIGCTENILLGKLGGNVKVEVKVNFSRSWETTVVGESDASYLPDRGACVQFHNRNNSIQLLPGSITNQMAFFKTLQRRDAKVQKEIQCMPRFLVSCLPMNEEFCITLECTLIADSFAGDNLLPPLLLRVPVNYPTIPVEYSFTGEYDSVPHLRVIRKAFETLVLCSDELASVHGFLGFFQDAVEINS